MASETPVNQRYGVRGLHLPTIREVYEDLVRHAVQESGGTNSSFASLWNESVRCGR